MEIKNVQFVACIYTPDAWIKCGDRCFFRNLNVSAENSNSELLNQMPILLYCSDIDESHCSPLMAITANSDKLHYHTRTHWRHNMHVLEYMISRMIMRLRKEQHSYGIMDCMRAWRAKHNKKMGNGKKSYYVLDNFMSAGVWVCVCMRNKKFIQT